RCGSATDQTPERVLTLNGAIRPQIPISPGAREFWRIVNTSPDRYVDLQLGGEQLEIVALDGMPLTYHDRSRGTRKANHMLVAPAGRVEAFVVAPAAGSGVTFSTRCVDTGPDGDPNPAMVIADVVVAAHSDLSMHHLPSSDDQPVYREISRQTMEPLE